MEYAYIVYFWDMSNYCGIYQNIYKTYYNHCILLNKFLWKGLYVLHLGDISIHAMVSFKDWYIRKTWSWYPMRVFSQIHPIIKSRKISNVREYILLCIWKATQPCFQYAYRNSERLENSKDYCYDKYRHQMETFYALLAICAGNSPVPGEFPSQRPVTRSFDVFFALPLNNGLSKQSWGWWFETQLHPLWRNCNDVTRKWWDRHLMIRKWVSSSLLPSWWDVPSGLLQ